MCRARFFPMERVDMDEKLFFWFGATIFGGRIMTGLLSVFRTARFEPSG